MLLAVRLKAELSSRCAPDWACTARASPASHQQQRTLMLPAKSAASTEGLAACAPRSPPAGSPCMAASSCCSSTVSQASSSPGPASHACTHAQADVRGWGKEPGAGRQRPARGEVTSAACSQAGRPGRQPHPPAAQLAGRGLQRAWLPHARPWHPQGWRRGPQEAAGSTPLLRPAGACSPWSLQRKGKEQVIRLDKAGQSC